MKASLDTARKYLKKDEDIQSALYCKVNFGYISRSGILAATNEKLLFCADFMFGEGLKWEFDYGKIKNFNESNGIIYGTIPFMDKIMFHYGDDYIYFDSFTSPSKVSEFSELVKAKI